MWSAETRSLRRISPRVTHLQLGRRALTYVAAIALSIARRCYNVVPVNKTHTSTVLMRRSRCLKLQPLIKHGLLWLQNTIKSGTAGPWFPLEQRVAALATARGRVLSMNNWEHSLRRPFNLDRIDVCRRYQLSLSCDWVFPKIETS